VNDFLTKLNDSMMNDHVAVNPERNPISVRQQALSLEQLQYVIWQYTIFPRNIVSFLLIARDKARKSGYRNAGAELTRNIGEELGTESGGVSHYEMLLNGLNSIGMERKELWRDWVLHTKPSKATSRFLCDIRDVFAANDMAYVFGATYAIECSAVPELRIVKALVEKLCELFTGTGAIQDPAFKTFFDMHIGTWEPGHEEGLRKVVEGIGKDRLFEHGFRDVMVTMDAWWNGMDREIPE
jgi:hypothetical protein